MKVKCKKHRGVRPYTLVYLLLIVLTLVTWRVGEIGLSGLHISLLVLGIALFKGHLIGDWFMGLRGLSGPWRWVVLIWLFVPGVLITWAFAQAAG